MHAEVALKALPTRYIGPMCNLYHMSPREHVERYFRVQVPEGYREAAVGPFNTGLLLRRAGEMAPADVAMEAVMGQWGMIGPGSKTRRPSSRASNSRAWSNRRSIQASL